jgi:hypothetical protein
MKKICFLFLVFAKFNSFSQWNGNAAVNNTVCTAVKKQDNPKIISDLKGGAIIVWEDYRNDTVNADIFIQRISNSGKTLWANDGVALCTDPAAQNSPVITTDSVGGAIVVWEDKRSGKRNLFAQRVDSTGTILWTSNGVGVSLSPARDQRNTKLLPDGSKGAIAIWQDTSGTSYRIMAQRLNSSGIAQWIGGSTVSAVPFSESNPKAQITPSGEIFITWQDKRNGSDYDIYVQKLNLSGAPQWLTNGVNISNIAGTQSNPKISLDNAGGVVVVWQDKRGGIDYDVFAQRVNTSGVPQWSANGISVSSIAGNQTAIDISSQFMSNAVVIGWKDGRGGANNLDIYAQRLDLSGVPQWSTNGIAIANGINNQINPNVTGDGSGGAIVAYQDSSSGTWDIRSQRVSAAGGLLWTFTGVDIGIAPVSQQVNHTNIGLQDGSSIYAFSDTRSGNNDIYAYKIDLNGNAVGVLNVFENKNNVKLYPNPANEKITFDMGKMIGQGTLVITDAQGGEMFRDHFENSSSYEFRSILKAGVYFFNISGKDISANGKFVISDK